MLVTTHTCSDDMDIKCYLQHNGNQFTVQ
jgi:hypothetical protein